MISALLPLAGPAWLPSAANSFHRAEDLSGRLVALTNVDGPFWFRASTHSAIRRPLSEAAQFHRVERLGPPAGEPPPHATWCWQSPASHCLHAIYSVHQRAV